MYLFDCVYVRMCVCERERELFIQLYCVSSGSPLRIAVLTAGHRPFQYCENKVNVVVVLVSNF